MSKQGGSLPRGRRLRHEVPEVPRTEDLTTVERTAQPRWDHWSEEGGGRFDSATAIPLGSITELADLLDAWGRSNASEHTEDLYFGGRPGLWHALDRLYPLQDPNRWDRLRKKVILELEHRGWRRASPPRGVSFFLPER
ncbi:MAG: hypothetical protein HYX34_00075 [Actinobacteria bacterium]|nr:hypothetical protein [Actinomycetota bacterium]